MTRVTVPVLKWQVCPDLFLRRREAWQRHIVAPHHPKQRWRLDRFLAIDQLSLAFAAKMGEWNMSKFGIIAKALDTKVQTLKDALGNYDLNVTSKDLDYKSDQLVFAEFTITAPEDQKAAGSEVNKVLDIADFLIDGSLSGDVEFGTAGNADLIIDDGAFHTEAFRIEYNRGDWNFIDLA